MVRSQTAALGLAALLAAALPAAEAASDPPPVYTVAPGWPRELPNNWTLGQVGGMAIDRHDHVWVLQRPLSATEDELGAERVPPRNDCCVKAPAVLEFDREGKVLRSWGGAGFVPDWPTSEHAIWVDASDNVWISGAGVDDRQVIKFSADGRELLEIGRKSRQAKDNQDTSLLGRAAGLEVDDAAHELYVADGYLNNRIVVFDSDTGAFKRGWGAYGIPLSEIPNLVEHIEADVPAAGAIAPYTPGGSPEKQFRSPVHCVRLSLDGLVYVCDRHNDRIQVFTRAGRFVREFAVRPATLGNGSTWTLTFSHDKAQKFLLVVDGENNVIWIVRRGDGVIVAHIGHSGRNAGQFHWVHQAVMDSRGDLYTGEVETGKRLQKFVLGTR